MIKLHKLVATVLGIGYVGKGGGTIAAAACCLLWLLIPAGNYNYRLVFLTAIVCFAGVWSSNVVDGIWGKDSSKVVIDEVAGMMITLLFIPINPRYVLSGLILFRFFDIAKPLGIRKLESLPKGWGVMADDALAGIYAHIILAAIVHFNIY